MKYYVKNIGFGSWVLFSLFLFRLNIILRCDFFFLKGKYKLATEIKEKEIEGLKETLKTLQVE